MGFFDIDDKKIENLYHRASLEKDRGFVDVHENANLEHALFQYAKENNCSLDEAYLKAKFGK